MQHEKILPTFSSNAKLNRVLSIFVSSTEKIAEKCSFNTLLFVVDTKDHSTKVKEWSFSCLVIYRFFKRRIFLPFFLSSHFYWSFPWFTIVFGKDCFQCFIFWAEVLVCGMSEHMILNRKMSRTKSTIKKNGP